MNDGWKDVQLEPFFTESSSLWANGRRALIIEQGFRLVEVRQHGRILLALEERQP